MIGKWPGDFIQLQEKIQNRFGDRLQNELSFHEDKFGHHDQKNRTQSIYIYYKDISNGLIRIEDDIDLKSSIDYCQLYDKKALKLYGKQPIISIKDYSFPITYSGILATWDSFQKYVGYSINKLTE
jgi:hypothetical protein